MDAHSSEFYKGLSESKFDEIILGHYKTFNQQFIMGIFTRQYDLALIAIDCLGIIADKYLPNKRAYVRDIREIVEHAIITLYSKETGIPIEEVDKEDVERNHHFYASRRDMLEEIIKLSENFGKL